MEALGHLSIEFTFDDPKSYSKPWSTTIPFVLMPDTEFIEHACENEQSYKRMTGF